MSYVTDIPAATLIQILAESSCTRVNSTQARRIAMRLRRIFPDGVVIFHMAEEMAFHLCSDGNIHRYSYGRAMFYVKGRD
eukprot:1942091-Karenia_brevis.AAC.1